MVLMSRAREWWRSSRSRHRAKQSDILFFHFSCARALRQHRSRVPRVRMLVARIEAVHPGTAAPEVVAREFGAGAPVFGSAEVV